MDDNGTTIVNFVSYDEVVFTVIGTNDPSSLGQSVSHGCIRMDNVAITKLTKLLPLGVPVQMI